MRTTLIVVLAVLCVSIVLVVHHWVQEDARRQLRQIVQYSEVPAERGRVLRRLARSLRAGMTKEVVRGILGSPDNVDKNVVWMWDLKDGPREIGRFTWRRMFELGRCGTFILFGTGGKLLTPHLAKDSEPGQIYSSITGMSLPKSPSNLGSN